MRIVVISLLLSIFCNFSVSAAVIYVSSSEGSDTNDGLTQDTPLKSIKFAFTKGDTVLLKSDDVFCSTGIKLMGKCLSKYGMGSNPVIKGYKRLITPRWENVENNIWKLSLTDVNFTGVELHGSSMSNNIGCLHEYDKDVIHGHKVRHMSELKKNWDIWQTERFDNQTPASEFDFLFLYYDSNPNDLKLEFSITDIAVNMKNSVIDGIDIQGFGFGILVESKSCITNCRIDAIGGRTQIGYECFTCYGNGIEVWSGASDCLIERCTISRCYDSGCTIQGHSGPPKNIVFRHNLIVDCCQGWEDFLSNENPEMVYNNCLFEDNIVVNSGKTTGFNYPNTRFKYCHILGNNYKGDKGMIFRNNTFVGGNYYCSGAYNGKYKSNKWQGNNCVIKRGDFLLGNYTGTKDVIRVPMEKGEFPTLKDATEDAISRYRELTGDMTTKFIIKDEKAINKQITKLKRKYLKE